MLIHYKENGFIDLIQSDPGDEATANLLALGGYMHLPAIPMPEVAVRDADGKPVIVDGKVKKEIPGYTQPEVTHDLHMVVDGKVVERPTLPTGDIELLADGKDTYTLDGLPRPCVINVDGEDYEVKGGVLHFSTKDAGTYLFKAGFPFVDWSVKVVAKAVGAQ